AAEGVELSMSEVDDLHDAQNQRQPDTQQRIRAPEYQRIGYVLKKLIHNPPHFRAWTETDENGALSSSTRIRSFCRRPAQYGPPHANNADRRAARAAWGYSWTAATLPSLMTTR